MNSDSRVAGAAAPLEEARVRAVVLKARIDVLTWSGAVERIVRWAQSRESRVVCICNAHSTVTATADSRFFRAVDECDMATPDGAPVAWMISRLRQQVQERINGPDLMWRLLERVSGTPQAIYLYGGKQSTLDRLVEIIGQRFPDVRVAGAYSPPFRPLTEEEDEAVVSKINASGASILFVGLGCPKQEIWMIERRGRIQAVMLGVGAAFDYHAGVISRAPVWMQRHGLEWLHRLWSEPRRLWRRYLVTNTLFVLMATRQLMFRRGLD